MEKYPENGTTGRHRQGQHDHVVVHAQPARFGVDLAEVLADRRRRPSHQEQVGDAHALLGLVSETHHQADVEHWAAADARRLSQQPLT